MTATMPAPRRGGLVPDLLLALLVAVLLLIGSGVSLEDEFEFALTGDDAGRWLPDARGLLLVLAGSLPLIFRRIAPLTVFTASAAASIAYRALGYGTEPLPLGVLVALYTVGVVRRPLVCSAAVAVYVAVLTLGKFTGWSPLADDQYYTDLVCVVATVMLSYGVALGRARASLAEQRAGALARDQDGRMRAAVEREQARIAREVHDIVAHDVSVIVAQAAAARRVSAGQPQVAADALASIEAVGRDALDGLRRMVVLLRTQADRSDRSPQPTLDRLPWLLAQVQRAGLPVTLTIRGQPYPLPATVELNAFRIVQEALTNSLKHAGPTRATVVLDYQAGSLRVEVRDEGHGERRGGAPSGFGLISMQQRAAMLGGELIAGPEAERGFRVSAWLPVAAST
ncbi:MAG TPA: sensor histidine kinase [Blastococcus sp.]|jgi:signal transduction histidine kinase